MGSNLGTAYGRIVVDGSGAAKGFATAGRSATGFAKVSKVAFAGVAVAGVGFGAAMASAVSVAADFEQSLANLRSVIRPTGEDFDALREQALQLGADTIFSAQEVAGAQVELAKGGLEAADILGGALPGALALAAAGDLELADAASYAVNAMKMFNLEGKDVERVADAMAVAANVTTADVQDFGEALSNGGAQARTAGYSFNDTMVVLNALADASVKGGEAGTAMKSAFLQLLNPTEKQAKVAKDLGINFLTANGELKDAVGISKELRRATDGMTRAERTRTMAQLAGTYGIRTLLALYDAGPAQLRGYEQALTRQGAAAETAAIKQDTLHGKLEELGGAAETIKIRVGSFLIPALADAAVATADWLSTLADSEGLESFGAGIADGFQQGIEAIQTGWGIAQPILAQIGPIGADAFNLLGSAASGAAPVIGVVFQVLAGGATMVLAVVGPLVSLAGALMAVPGGAQAAAAAVVGLGAALLALRAAAVASSAASFAAAWAPYVSLAGRTAVEVTKASGAMGLLRFATAGLVSPAGLATAGIGLLAGGLTLLMSGAFAGQSAAERLADALNNVKTAADGAKGALSGFTGAVDRMKDADIQVVSAKANLISAQENLNRVMKDSTSTEGQRAQAQAALLSAERQLSVAQRDRAKAQREVSKSAVEGVVSLARLSTEITRGETVTNEQAFALEKWGRSMGVPEEKIAGMVAQQRKLANQGATTEDRMNALRRSIAAAARDMDTSTKSGREAAKVLGTLGDLDGAGLMTFAERVQTLEREGVPAATALEIALTEAAQDRTVQLDAEDHASEVADGVKRAVAGLQDKTVTLRAIDAASGVARSVAGAIASIPVTKITTLITRPKHETGSPTVYQTIDMVNAMPARVTKTVAFRPQGTGAMEMAVAVARGFDLILEAREQLDAQLAAIDAREETRQQRLERARLKREVRSTARKLAKAKADEKAAARSAANQARAAMVEFDRQARLEARRRPLQLKLDRIQLADTAMSDLESALSDVGSRITDALQRAFDSALSGLDASLKQSMDGIDATLAGSLGYVDAHLKAMLDQIDSGLQATLDGIDSALKSTMAQIEASTEAMRVKAIDAATKAARAARQQRDDARKLAELQATAGAADARVSRLQGVLAGARTDSERQAAQALLDAALAEQVAAAEALADFQEDQHLAALAAEKEALEAILQARRDAAQTAHDDAKTAAEADAQAQRDHWTAWAEGARAAAEERAAIDRAAAQALYDQRRAAAEAEFVARQAETARQLGDLREQLRSGEITHRQFLKRLQAIYEDPTISKALTDSGKTLGLDFARGLDRSKAQVEKSAKALAAIVRKYLKLNSPADAGPLRYDPEEPGRIIGASLAAGMASQRRAVEQMARQLAEAAAMTIPASWSAMEAQRRGVGPGAWVGGSSTVNHSNSSLNQTVNVQVQNAVEDAREVGARMSYEARMAGGRF